MCVIHIDYLLETVQNLHVPYGYERSFKIIERDILSNRYIVSLLTETLNPNPYKTLFEICEPLHIPTFYSDQIKTILPIADMIHLGIEQKGSEQIYKLYLEFSELYFRAVRLAIPQGKCNPLDYGFAIKWTSSVPPQSLITRYVSYPLLRIPEIEKKILSHYSERKDLIPCQTALQLLYLAAQKVTDWDIKYGEVIDPGTSRYSFDLNVYRCKMKVQEIRPLLCNILRYFNISDNTFLPIYESAKQKSMGHITGGITRNGKEFFTLYYGFTEYRWKKTIQMGLRSLP